MQLTVFLLILLGLAVIFWYEVFRTREQVTSHCERACRDARLQLLDQSVTVAAFRFRIGRGFVPDLIRTYRFEYSEDGTERLLGYVDLVNNTIQSTRFTGKDGETIYHH